MSINTNPFQVRAGNLPLGFNGTWQDFVDQLPNLLDITVKDGFSTFVTGSVTPTSNQGPWFQDGKTLFVWDNDLAAYRGVSLTDSSRGFQISQTAPTQTSRFLWFRTNASGVPQDVRAFQGGEWRAFGYSRADIARIIPRGLTCAWSGTIAQLAAETDAWFLADGGTYNGFTTRDLRDRFIVGAGNEYAVGDTGGANQVTLGSNNLPPHRHQAGNITGTAEEAGSHRHLQARLQSSLTVLSENNDLAFAAAQAGNSYILRGSTSSDDWAGRGQSAGLHTHNVTLNGNSGTGVGLDNDPVDTRPPYYALAYITFCGLPS